MSISPADRGQWKYSVPLNHMVYLDKIAYLFLLKCQATAMQNGDEVARRI